MKPIRNSAIQSKLLPDGHVVLVSQENDWAHTLTPLAGIAWEFCDGEHSEQEIIEMVAEVSGVGTAEQIHADIQKLFAELKETGLLSDSATAEPVAV